MRLRGLDIILTYERTFNRRTREIMAHLAGLCDLDGGARG